MRDPEQRRQIVEALKKRKQKLPGDDLEARDVAFVELVPDTSQQEANNVPEDS